MTDQDSLLSGETDSPWAPLADRANQRLAKRDAVLRTAARLFLARGPHRVTMNEVADALNITKPALYNYFKSKDEIIIECFRMGNEMTVRILDALASADLTGREKLTRFMRDYAKVGTIDFGACMIRFDERELPPAGRDEVQGYKRSIDKRVRSIIADAVADGSLEPCDEKLATFAVFGILNSISNWYDPAGAHNPEDIGGAFADMLIGGLAAGKSTDTQA